MLKEFTFIAQSLRYRGTIIVAAKSSSDATNILRWYIGEKYGKDVADWVFQTFIFKKSSVALEGWYLTDETLSNSKDSFVKTFGLKF